MAYIPATHVCDHEPCQQAIKYRNDAIKVQFPGLHTGIFCKKIVYLNTLKSMLPVRPQGLPIHHHD